MYVIAPSIVASIINTSLYVSSDPADIGGLAFGSSPTLTGLNIAIGLVFQGLTIYLVIIWSRQHNRQFDQPTTQTQTPT
jgi:hypothetical protein